MSTDEKAALTALVVVGAICSSFLAVWLVTIIYNHFAWRFGWPGLSYWEVYGIYFVLWGLRFNVSTTK